MTLLSSLLLYICHSLYKYPNYILRSQKHDEFKHIVCLGVSIYILYKQSAFYRFIFPGTVVISEEKHHGLTKYFLLNII